MVKMPCVYVGCTVIHNLGGVCDEVLDNSCYLYHNRVMSNTRKPILTVGQLRKVLEGVPDSLLVLTRGYESGLDGAERVEIIEVYTRVEPRQWEGEFVQEREGEDATEEDPFAAVVIRNRSHD